MQNLVLPHVNMPSEFTTLLKTNLTTMNFSGPIFDIIRPNKTLFQILQKTFLEFDDGRGIKHTMIALGWPNFRDRVASLYIYKNMLGIFPVSTNIGLVEEIKNLEGQLAHHGLHGSSRIFLLGFYLRLANINLQKNNPNDFFEFKIPEEIGAFLKLSNAKSEKIDWLILILIHLSNDLGAKLLLHSLAIGKDIDELYSLLSPEARKMMFNNLLAYGSSINESELFLYGKI